MHPGSTEGVALVLDNSGEVSVLREALIFTEQAGASLVVDRLQHEACHPDPYGGIGNRPYFKVNDDATFDILVDDIPVVRSTCEELVATRGIVGLLNLIDGSRKQAKRIMQGLDISV